MAPDRAAHGVKRMRGDGEPALSMNEPDGVRRREVRRYALAKVEADQVAVECADLFADDDVDSELRDCCGRNNAPRVLPGSRRDP